MPVRKSNIQLGTIVGRNLEQEFTRIDNEVVMLSQTNGEYYALNEVASRIWEILDEPVKVQNIIQQLMDEFEIGHDVCSDQTIQLLNELYEKSLILIIENA